MAPQHGPSMSHKSSIRYWWIPRDVQPFELDHTITNGNAHLQSKLHAKNSKEPETKYSSNRVSTSQFVSAVAGMWGYVGQPAVFQTKSSLKYGEICSKENIFFDSGSLVLRPKSSCGGASDDLTSTSCSFSSAKSNFEDLKKIKRILCFASCNRNVNNLSVLSDSHSNVESSGHDKVTSIGATIDLAYEYGDIITKPYFDLKAQVRLTRNPPANQSSTQNTENNSAVHGEDSSSGQSVNIVENVVHSHDFPYTTYSLQSQPVTSTKETIIISTSPSSGNHSDYNLGVLTMTDWTLRCQQSTDSSCIAVKASAEVSTSKDHIVDEKCKALCHEVVVDEDCSTRHWSSIQDKLQLAFAKNKHALAGALAGTFVSLCLHPVDTVKTVIQANGTVQKSSGDIIRTIISERGLLGLYRGIASNIASSAPISAIYTYTYESVKGSLLPLLPKEYHSFAHCIAGGCSSIATSFVFTPSERIKQQMQVGSQYQNCWSALIGCLEKGGVPSLYAGWGAVLCRNIPHSIIKFYTYESLKQLFLTSSQSNANLSTFQTLVCGGLAGSTAALFTTPFDVVKTRLQTQVCFVLTSIFTLILILHRDLDSLQSARLRGPSKVPGSLAKYDGVLLALQEIAREEGLQGLYRGLTPRLTMYVCQGAIFFTSYEFLKAIFSLETPRAPSRVIGSEENANPAPSRLQKLIS